MTDDVKSDPPRGPFPTAALPWTQWTEGVRFAGRYQVLSNTKTTTMRIGVVIDVLEPGKQSCPFHYHMLEEEHAFILEGEVTLRLGDEERLMRAGDFVSFPAGRKEGHCFINRGAAPCRYLVIGDRQPHEVCVYPDSGKVMVDAIGGEIFRRGESIDYWDGEKADEPL
ncbi:MAG: cupin domain-containing protein [Alphaproteobacteria bacterium]|nr:cupin domain-containing protein [Alphaproteobacteria bacterium]